MEDKNAQLKTKRKSNMTDENLLVSWQDFETSCPDILRNLWDDQDFTDVTLATGDGQQFRAHRVILSSATTKLRSILRNPEKCENLFLYLPDVQSTHLRNLLEFIYQGRCQVEQADFEEFLSCSRSLGIENLTESLESTNAEGKLEKQYLTSSNQRVGVLEEEKRGDIVTETPQPKPKSEECPVCEKMFSAKNLMNKHLKRCNIHNRSKDIKKRHCSLCGLSFDFRNFRRHLKTKHAENVKRCDDCKYETVVEKELNEHIERRHKKKVKKIRKCSLCDRVYTSASNLKRHFFEKHAEKKYKCHGCEYETAVEKELHDHIERGHKGRVFNCEQCAFEANKKYELEYHIKSIHDLVKMKCDQCDYECEYKNGCKGKMRRHKSLMHGEEVFNCDQCDYQSDITAVTRHKKFVHTRANHISCNQCDFKAVSIWHVEIHKKGAHEGVRWPCNVCTKLFKSPSLLRLHTKSIHDKIVHRKTCDICDFSVESNSYKGSSYKIRKHEDLVHAQVDYKCEHCDFISKSRGALSQHKSNKHSTRTKTTFVCDQCSYTSKQKGHLDIHMRSKHQGELIKCDMCDYKATQLSNLVRHKRSKHLVEEK